MHNLVYFDLETQNAFRGALRDPSQLKISIAVTYTTAHRTYTIYTENEIPQLLDTLQRADAVIGYNILDFDFRVLSNYTLFDLSHIPTLDLMKDLERSIGNRIGLTAVAQATLGIGKTSDGLEAIRLWQAKQYRQVAEYCCYDVKLTRLLHEYGAYHGKIHYMNKRTLKMEQALVSWKPQDILAKNRTLATTSNFN
ncbi:MAG: ribonuclease H-like domain-containing protein [Methylacidiphilales bacterium]|nr:ribonuclease H-like domain-containing protein [Candidatus Methylacidiphilales bacterium]MDW8350067.1 ribonuclease H-like domain-containing protein [Verrucomicrobiae bacterium]